LTEHVIDLLSNDEYENGGADEAPPRIWPTGCCV